MNIFARESTRVDVVEGVTTFIINYLKILMKFVKENKNFWKIIFKIDLFDIVHQILTDLDSIWCFIFFFKFLISSERCKYLCTHESDDIQSISNKNNENMAKYTHSYSKRGNKCVYVCDAIKNKAIYKWKRMRAQKCRINNLHLWFWCISSMIWHQKFWDDKQLVLL